MWLPVQRAPGPADGVSGWLNWSMSPGFSRRRIPHILGSLIAEAFHASGLEVPRATVLTLSLLIRNGLLASGRYLTMLPGSMLRFGANYLPLKVLPIELPIRPQPVGIVTLRNRTLNPVAQLFLDCAREVARPLAEEK